MDPGEAAEGSQLEESVTVNLQCHDEALRVAYAIIIYYGNNNQDLFNSSYSERVYQVRPSVTSYTAQAYVSMRTEVAAVARLFGARTC